MNKEEVLKQLFLLPREDILDIYEIINGYKDNLTIDRIDNDGNYEPKNCRWITIQEQQKNKKRKIKADLVVKVEE